MAKERKRLINEDMVSEVPPAMHHPVPSVESSVHHRKLGKSKMYTFSNSLYYDILVDVDYGK